MQPSTLNHITFLYTELHLPFYYLSLTFLNAFLSTRLCSSHSPSYLWSYHATKPLWKRWNPQVTPRNFDKPFKKCAFTSSHCPGGNQWLPAGKQRLVKALTPAYNSNSSLPYVQIPVSLYLIGSDQQPFVSSWGTNWKITRKMRSAPFTSSAAWGTHQKKPLSLQQTPLVLKMLPWFVTRTSKRTESDPRFSVAL